MASIPADHRIDDSALIPHVEDVLKKAGWLYSDLTNLACVIGPGGFTSLRVAVALANALSHELKIPSAGLHLSDIYGFRVAGCGLRESSLVTRPSTSLRTSNSKPETFVWLHSTKKHELFLRGFGDLSQEFPEPQSITIDDLKKIMKRGSRWTGELIPEHQQIMAERSGAGEVCLVSQQGVLPEFLKKQNYKKQILRPWYGRGW